MLKMYGDDGPVLGERSHPCTSCSALDNTAEVLMLARLSIFRLKEMLQFVRPKPQFMDSSVQSCATLSTTVESHKWSQQAVMPRSV